MIGTQTEQDLKPERMDGQFEIRFLNPTMHAPGFNIYLQNLNDNIIKVMSLDTDVSVCQCAKPTTNCLGNLES